MASTITLFLGLLVAIIVFASIATAARIPYAILLVLGGALLGFVPDLPNIELSPELILFLFLPPLVYSSAWQASWREFRANIRPILQLAVGLVLFTTTMVAVVAHSALGLPWAIAFTLGAIVSPTDAVAASATAQRMGLPHRTVTIIEGESMVNDVTGLVAYSFAVAAVATGTFSLWQAGLQFLFVSAGGLLIGLGIGWLVAWLHRRLEDAAIEITITLLTPFAASLLAEAIHVSGILATLAAGLYLSRRSSRFFSSNTRLQANAVWNVLIFLLNGLLFLLIGLQLRSVLNGLGERSIINIVWEALLVSLAVMVVRIAWVFSSVSLSRFISARLQVRDPYPDWRNVAVVAWTGLRGGVSLAAALALPLALDNGGLFPDRDLLIALTFGVILVTLVGQGLSLIPLVRHLKIPVDSSLEQEELQARLVAARAALARLQTLCEQDWVPDTLLSHLRSRYEDRVRNIKAQLDGMQEQQEEKQATHERLRHEAIQAERAAVIQLRDQGKIHDEVLRDLEREFDLEEQRLQA